MTIWGKILGAAAGFALGGPIGALIGGLAGHAVDTLRPSETAQPDDEQEDRDETKEIAFTIGVIVLAAKMAKADGVVTRDEIAAFREVFHVPPDELRNVQRLFDIAKRDSDGFRPYARQIANLLRHRPPVLEKLIDGLFHIAKADGGIHAAELRFLRDVAEIFGLDDAAFDRICITNGVSADGGLIVSPDPYQVLGLDPTASDEEAKSTYRRLIRENHPDLLMAAGMPPEFVDLATEQTARLNDAWARIRKDRHL